MTTSLFVTVEAAFGADLTANPATWVWTDISVYARGSVTVRRGKPDRGSTESTEFQFRLDNTDFRFTPGHAMSVNYGLWDIGTPLRVKLNPGTGAVIRAQGYADTIEPTFPSGNSMYAEVRVSASGSLQRLGQGDLLRSALVRSLLSPVPIAAWALDDGSDATQLASSVIGGTPMRVLDSGVTLGVTDSALPGAAASITLAAGVIPLPGTGQVVGAATYTNSGFLAIRVWLKVAGGTGTIQGGDTVAWTMAGGGSLYHGTIDLWGPGFPPAGVQFSALGTLAWAPPVTGTGPPGVTIDPTDGAWHEVFVTLQQSGADVNVNVYLDGQLGTTSTMTSETLNPISKIWVNGYMNGSTDSRVSVAMLALYTDPTAAANYSAGFGYVGEVASARVTRLCGEENVPVVVTGTSTVQLGAQSVDTLLNLLKDCETADQGILGDGLTAGLTYVAGAARYNPAVTMALDTNRLHAKLPFGPIADDSRIRNDVTASRPSGSSARYVDSDPTHRRSTVKAGVYPDPYPVNVAADGDLLNQAAWQVHLGTVEEMRVPALPIMPSDTPEIIASWLACDIGSRYTLANPPTQFPPGGVDQVLESYVETFDKVTWKVQLVGSPASVWRVNTIEDLLRGRLETGGSQLASSVTTTATSWSLATTVLPLWTTTALFPADFPFDLNCEGEQVRVTALSGTSSPQTATVTRSINGVVKAHSAGAAVSLWQPAPLAL